MRDCFFLVADKNMEGLLKGFFLRKDFHLSLGCSPFQFDAKQDLLVAHGQNDSGLYTRANELLCSYRKTHRHAVVMLDAEWDGSPGAAVIRERMSHHFEQVGWATDTACAVVIEPELENWIWQDTPHLCAALGYQGSFDELRSELERQGAWPISEQKPPRPKETLESLLRNARKPRSSSLYQDLAGLVSVRRCTDTAFQILLMSLLRWFPKEVRPPFQDRG